MLRGTGELSGKLRVLLSTLRTSSQYLHSDGSDTATTHGNTTNSSTRPAATTKWLRSDKKLGTIGEFTAAVRNVCKDALAVAAKL